MILAEQSPGVCVADYDGDGWPDIYFPNEGDVHERKVDTRNALYHKQSGRRFHGWYGKAGAPLWTLVRNSVAAVICRKAICGLPLVWGKKPSRK